MEAVMDLAILIARVVLGLSMSAHGAQKLFGWFGGPGLPGIKKYVESVGFHPPRFFAVALGLTEFGSGLLTALGLFGPIGPAGMILVMIVAAVVGHLSNGFFAMANGIEVNVIYATGALALAFAGPAAYSLDALFGIGTIWTAETTWAIVALAIVGAFVNLGLRRTPHAALVNSGS
jgi:putative oxidoreductase